MRVLKNVTSGCRVVRNGVVTFLQWLLLSLWQRNGKNGGAQCEYPVQPTIRPWPSPTERSRPELLKVNHRLMLLRFFQLGTTITSIHSPTLLRRLSDTAFNLRNDFADEQIFLANTSGPLALCRFVLRGFLR